MIWARERWGDVGRGGERWGEMHLEDLEAGDGEMWGDVGRMIWARPRVADGMRPAVHVSLLT